MFGYEDELKDEIEDLKEQLGKMYSKKDMIATFHYGHQIGMNDVLSIQSQHSPQPIPKPDIEKLKTEWFKQFEHGDRE